MPRAAECARKVLSIFQAALPPSHPDIMDAAKNVSNSGGAAHTTSAGDIKAQAKDAFLSKEKETDIGPVIFEKSALPQTTPIDSSGRPMVAPPTEQGNVPETDR